MTGSWILALLLGAALLALHARWRVAVRAEYIRSCTLPEGLFVKLQQRRPGLSLKDCQLTAHAMRQFFLAYLKGGRKFVSMPSQIVDELWHEFILHTRSYEAFCRRAFGRFLHHSPAAVLGSERQSNAGLRRVWWYACREENINPRAPTRLPLLFAIDAKLQIADGFHYVADCRGLHKTDAGAHASAIVYCGGDFGSPAFDGTTDGFGEAGSGDAAHAGGGDAGGHGCGGHGCGGGGCGGGGGGD